MKIHNDVTNAVRHDAKAGKTTNATSAKPAAQTTPTDRVQISEAGRALHTGGTDAPFDAQKVDAIKAAISAGTFKVNADAVAGKVLDSVGQLLTGQS